MPNAEVVTNLRADQKTDIVKRTAPFIQALGISFLSSIGFLIIGALIFTFTNIPLEYVKLFASLVTFFGAATSGFYASKKIKKNGLITGILAGSCYVFALYICGGFVKNSFKITSSSLFLFLFSALFGSFGGILGVNNAERKKETKKRKIERRKK